MKDYVVAMETGRISNRPIIRGEKSMSPINVGIVKKWEETDISEKESRRIDTI